MIFRIKSVILSKKNLTVNLYINFIFEKKRKKKQSYSDEATDFPDRKIPEAGSGYSR